MNPVAPRPLRVVIFGPESTGKSTLAERLAERFAAPWSPEFVREFWDAHGGVITAADLHAIARGQRAAEDAAQARAVADGARVVFHDTDLLTCMIWDDLLFPGSCPEWLRVEADIQACATDLYLFCDTDLPWTPDPQRCFPDEAGREMCRRFFLEKLEATGARWTRIHGSDAAREARASAAVELLLNRRAYR